MGEDYLDLGILYCSNAESRREYIRSSLFLLIGMARRLGFPMLAADILRAFQEVLATESLVTTRSDRDHSFLLTAV